MVIDDCKHARRKVCQEFGLDVVPRPTAINFSGQNWVTVEVVRAAVSTLEVEHQRYDENFSAVAHCMYLHIVQCSGEVSHLRYQGQGKRVWGDLLESFLLVRN